jgi:hypothetical protein
MNDSDQQQVKRTTVVGTQRRLTAEQVAKLRAAPGLVFTGAEVNEVFPDPDAGVSIVFKNEAGDPIDIEDLSPHFESEAAAAAYLDMLLLQILEMKAQLHFYFEQHGADVEIFVEEGTTWIVGHSGLNALSTDNPRLQPRGAGETIT